METLTYFVRADITVPLASNLTGFVFRNFAT